MSNATKYVDNVNGNNGNTGNSEAQAYADIATALANVTGDGNVIYVQATGTNYSEFDTAALSLTWLGTTTNGRNRIEGYTTTPGARDGRPTLTSSTNSREFFSCNGAGEFDLIHLKFTHTASTRGPLFSEAGNPPLQADVMLEDCIFDGLLNINESLAHGGAAYYLARCQGINFTTSGTILQQCTASIDGCYFRGNTGTPWAGNGVNCTVNVSKSIFAGGSYGLLLNDAGANRTVNARIFDSVFYDNTNDGFRVDMGGGGSLLLEFVNNIFYGNGGYGTKSLQSATIIAEWTNRVLKNFYGGNTSGPRSNTPAGFDDVTGLSDPFVDAANGNFALNNTAGAGALVRALGFPGAFPGGLTTSYADGGAVQHQEASTPSPVSIGIADEGTIYRSVTRW